VGKSLEGVRVPDMTHVHSGPSCTQILAWMDADVVKLEAPGGDITPKPLRDIADVDSPLLHNAPASDETVRLPGRRPSRPLLGEHNEDIYDRELCRYDDELASLKSKGDSCPSASCDDRRVPTTVDKTDMTSKFQ
jgi:hypothetical protein